VRSFRLWAKQAEFLCSLLLTVTAKVVYRTSIFLSCALIEVATSGSFRVKNSGYRPVTEVKQHWAWLEFGLKPESRLNNIYEFSPYRKETTTLHHYKVKLVNGV
jgi:hypothetical protein